MSSSWHSMVITKLGLYGWGCNNFGQLGLGLASLEQPLPKQIEGEYLQTALGFEHSLFLKSDHTLHSCGCNEVGQLGIETTSTTTPTSITTIPGTASKIATGEAFSMVLLADGSVYSWGANKCGQLGIGSSSPKCKPTLIPTYKFIDIDCGGSFAMASTRTGDLYSWGDNSRGQLGLGYKSSHCSPQRVRGIWNVMMFCCGWDHALALSKEGELYSWGNNIRGQLGLSNQDKATPIPTKVTSIPPNILKIACGGAHSMVLLKDGSLYAWGDNSRGQLGLGDTFDCPFPTKVTGISERVTQIRCGNYHSMAITAADELYCWGSNYNGQLGNGKVRNCKTMPRKVRLVEGCGRMCFEKEEIGVGVIQNWPLSHYQLSVEVQDVMEVVLLVSASKGMPRDIAVYCIKLILKIIQSKLV